jgi:hypothetical protein
VLELSSDVIYSKFLQVQQQGWWWWWWWWWVGGHKRGVVPDGKRKLAGLAVARTKVDLTKDGISI